MKKVLLLSTMGVLSSVATVAGAEEVGRVISSTPVVQQVAVPRQVCSQQQVMQPQNSGGGAFVGAIVGGLLGNTIGHGMGRAAATAGGVVAGAAIGDRMESSNNRMQYAENCTTQTAYENRTVAYNVQYEYAGKQFSVQMPYDPGQTIRLQLSPVGSNSASPEAAPAMQGGAMVVAPPVYSEQPVGQVIVPATTVYPVTYRPYGGYYGYGYPYYAPVGLSLSFGFSGGHHHRHRHWR